MKKFIDFSESAEFKPHMMYKDGKEKKANTHDMHLKLKAAGWGHDKEKLSEKDDPCWDSHEMIGMKKKNGKSVPNCVPKESVELVEANLIPQLQSISDNKQAKKIKGVLVDMFTASMITQIYSKVNDANKKKMENLTLEKLVNLAHKIMKKKGMSEESYPLAQMDNITESSYSMKVSQAWKKVKSLPNVRGISNSGKNHAKKLSSLLKSSPDKVTFEKLELALGTYEVHAYTAAEDKTNPHGKEDLAKLQEFCDSVDEVIGAMKNLHQSQLPEGFLDTFLGRNMKKGNVDKKKSKKSKNSEQVKLSTEIDRKLRLIDDLMKKVRPLGGNLGRLMAFRKLPIDKMTPKGMYVALNDWWDSVEADLDDDSEDDNEKYAQSAEKLYDLWEEVGFKLSDYMWASGYNVKGIGQMAKIGFPAKKRTDPEWLKMNESVDEGFMDKMKQLVPGARNPQKPQQGKKTAMEMQFPYARLSVHRMIVALRKARGTAMKGKAQGKDRRENERSLGLILAHVEDIARNRHTEQPNSGRQIHDDGNIDDITQQYFMDKIRQNDWTKADQEILNAMVGNGTDDNTKGGAYHARSLAHDIALSVKYAKKDAGIKESVELDEALNMQQRMARGRQMKRNKSKLARGRLKAAKRTASKDVLARRARKAARSAILSKMTKGMSKSDLSPARKKELEKKLEKPAFATKISRVAQKLLPKMRKTEIARRANRNKGTSK